MQVVCRALEDEQSYKVPFSTYRSFPTKYSPGSVHFIRGSIRVAADSSKTYWKSGNNSDSYDRKETEGC